MRLLYAIAASILSLTLFAAPDTADTWKKELRFIHQETFDPVPVIFIAFDELPLPSLMTPAGAIDEANFPTFARLQRDSIWFRNTTSTRTFTKEALPALLTGTSPVEQIGVRLDLLPHNIFTLLGDAYEIRAQERLPAMCPAGHCNDFGTKRLAPEVVEPLGRFGDGGRGQHLVRFLELIEPGPEPRFYFHHLVMPHEPWRYLPSGQRYQDPGHAPGEMDPPGRGTGWRDEPWLVAQGYQRHLLQTALTDRILGVIFDRLRAARLYRKSLVVVVADHGHAFVPGFPKRLPRAATAGHVAPVPFFLKLPFQQAGSISDLPVELTDVVPTLADVLDLSDTGGTFEGTSALAGSIEPDRARTVSNVALDPEGSEKYEVAEMKHEIFGTTERGLDLFRLGPEGTGGLVGRPVDSFAVTGVSEPLVRLPGAERVVSADPGTPAFPAYFDGSLESGTAGATLVIAVNGVVAAVTETFEQGDLTRFACMLSPRFFRAPPNEIGVYLLSDDRESLLALPLS